MFRCLVVSTALACAPHDPCITQTRAVDPESAVPFGVRAVDLADHIDGSWAGEFSTPDGSAAAMTLVLSWVGEADWADRTPSVSEGAASADLDAASRAVCADTLLLPFDLTLTTADGHFEAEWTVQLEALDTNGARVRHVVDPRELGGSWTPPYGASGASQVVFDATWSGTAVSGSLVLTARPRADGPEEAWTLAVFTAS